MARYVMLIISVLGFAIASNTAFSGASVPLTTGEWVDFALWKLEANGLTGPIFASSRPLGRAEIAQTIANMKKRIEDGSLRPSPHELKIIKRLEEEFLRSVSFKAVGLFTGEADYYYHGDPFHPSTEWSSPEVSSLSLWGASSFHPVANVTLYEEIDAGRGRDIVGKEGDTASRRIKLWKWDYTADFRRAFIHYHSERFEALLGREFLFWGPGYGGSLILSDNSPAFDMVLLSARFGSVKAIAFSAMLDKMWSERNNYRYLANRYLSGHRLDWLVKHGIELGLSELILYGGEARGMELQYVNPLIPYYASQWNSDQDNNVLVSADFAARPIDGLKVYGQLLVDDFNYADHDPNALGYIGGFYLSDPLFFSGTDIRAEYTRIDTWTYTHLVTENQFTHYGWVIGHDLGPDADQLFLELSQMINVDARLKLIYAFEREGIRTVKDRFRGEDYKRMKFPSGAVERRHKLGLQFLWERSKGQYINLLWQRFLIKERYSSSCEAPPKGEVSIKAGYLFD